MADQPLTREEVNQIVGGFQTIFNSNIQSMTREIFTALGQTAAKSDQILIQQQNVVDSLEDFKQITGEKFEEISAKLAQHDEQILTLNRSIFGDARVQSSPHVRRDIDRHESEIIGLNESVRQSNGRMSEILTNVGSLSLKFDEFHEGYRADMKMIITLNHISRKILPPISGAVKLLLEQRWSFILPAAAAIGAIASAAIEYLKAVGLF